MAAVGGLSVFACGGSSSSFDDNGDDSAGEGGSLGGSAGSAGSSKGGSAGLGGSAGVAGTATGGTATGGSAGTGVIDGRCEAIDACGGDPEGTWLVRDTCYEVVLNTFDEPGCENSRATGTADVQGSFSFTGGVMTQSLTTTARLGLTIDDACAAALTGLPVLAADLCPLLNAELSGNPDAMGSCAVVAEDCHCDIVQPAETSSQMSTYTVVGTQIVDASGSGIDFCAQPTTLMLHAQGEDAATNGLLGLTMLLDRQ